MSTDRYFKFQIPHEDFGEVDEELEKFDVDPNRCGDWQQYSQGFGMHDIRVEWNDRGQDVGYDFEIHVRGDNAEEIATEIQQRIVRRWSCSVIHY